MASPNNPIIERAETAPPPEYTNEKPASGPPDMGFIQHEPPMAYQPQPEPTPVPNNQPVQERGPRMVTPRTQVRSSPVDVDCPFCQQVVRTKVVEVSSGDDGMIQCLICLVCWPMLFCYEGNKDIDHHCSVCNKKLTHQPHGGQPLDVTAAQMRPALMPSQFEQR